MSKETLRLTRNFKEAHLRSPEPYLKKKKEKKAFFFLKKKKVTQVLLYSIMDLITR
jgi:hypothetical protein